jgi:hypothetical protein
VFTQTVVYCLTFKSARVSCSEATVSRVAIVHGVGFRETVDDDRPLGHSGDGIDARRDGSFAVVNPGVDFVRKDEKVVTFGDIGQLPQAFGALNRSGGVPRRSYAEHLGAGADFRFHVLRVEDKPLDSLASTSTGIPPARETQDL